jgi:TPR repeat protein
MERLHGVLTQLDFRCDTEEWDMALAWMRILVDEYHMLEAEDWDLEMVLSHIEPWNLPIWETEANNGNASSCFLAGYYHRMHGSEKKARTYFEKAAGLGHVLAIYYTGDLQRAIDLGCPKAMEKMAKRSKRIKDRLLWLMRAAHAGSVRSLDHLECTSTPYSHPAWRPAALWYARSSNSLTEYQYRDYMKICTSLGIWEPERNCHHMLPMQVRTEIMQWLLVSYRMNLIRDLRLLICAFIATD